MTRAISILAVWLTLLAQAGIGIAPQGTVVWLACFNDECPDTVFAPEPEERCSCCQNRERELDDSIDSDTYEGVVAPAPCCVTLVFPGSRGQPPAPARAEVGASVTDVLAAANAALPSAIPAWCDGAWPESSLACGRPPPKCAPPPLSGADRTVTARYRL